MNRLLLIKERVSAKSDCVEMKSILYLIIDIILYGISYLFNYAYHYVFTTIMVFLFHVNVGFLIDKVYSYLIMIDVISCNSHLGILFLIM